ncbi:MAG: MAPEG family protein [Alphaproteobacteria bacterium]
MTIALWCVLIGGLMPLAWTGVAKWGGENKLGPEENRNPRAWLATLGGMQERANAAQLNAIEAFPLFAAAVIVAHMLGADQGMADMLAMVWVALRLAYGVLYIADIGAARTLVWGAALATTVWIFTLAA